MCANHQNLGLEHFGHFSLDLADTRGVAYLENFDTREAKSFRG